MNRNLKILGLALVAVFAIGAMAASASSASVLTSDGPFTLTGSETGGTETNYLEAFGLKTKCPGSTYKGSAVGNPTGDLASGATTFTLKPTYVNCTTAGFPTTIILFQAPDNTCDFVLHLGSAGAVTGDQTCNSETDITVEVFFNATDHANNAPFCILHINPALNQGLGGATLSNGGGSPGDLNLTGAFEGLHAVATDPGSHPLLCPGTGSLTTNVGKLVVDLTVTGDNSSGTATEVSVS